MSTKKTSENKIEWSDIDRMKHMSWCLANNIRIYFKPVTMNEGVIVIEENGRPIVSADRYKTDNTLYKRRKNVDTPRVIWSERIMELYTIKYLEKNEY